MNTPSHILVGRFLCQYVKEKFGIRLEKQSFILGNVLPDFRPSFFLRPHYLENNISYVRNEIQNLLNTKQRTASIGKDFSKHIGIICHYYADFFCFAHIKIPHLNLVPHMKYESDLLRYIRDNPVLIKKADFTPEFSEKVSTDMICRQFDKLHVDYLQRAPSCSNDLTYCILACVEAIVLIAGLPEAEMRANTKLDNLSLHAV